MMIRIKWLDCLGKMDRISSKNSIMSMTVVWDPWPAELLPQQPMQIDVAPALGQNLNELPAAENPAIDLNQPALDLDLHPVIVNPEVPLNQDLIDLNDIHVNMFEQHLLQLENEVYLADPMEEELMDLADGMHQEQL